MAIQDIVTDPFLTSVLEVSALARNQATTIADLASTPTAGASSAHDLEISKQTKVLNTHLAQLRGLHRNAILGARQIKQQTAEARQEVDTLHLLLQNLYYEQRHLQGEIDACEAYE